MSETGLKGHPEGEPSATCVVRLPRLRQGRLYHRSAGRDFPALIERHHLSPALGPDPDLDRDQAGCSESLGVG